MSILVPHSSAYKSLFDEGETVRVKGSKAVGVVTRVVTINKTLWYRVHLANGTRTTIDEKHLEREGALEALASCGEGAS